MYYCCSTERKYAIKENNGVEIGFLTTKLYPYSFSDVTLGRNVRWADAQSLATLLTSTLTENQDSV